MDTRRFLFVLVLISAFIYVVSPLLLPLAMGAVFSALLYPIQKRLEDRKLHRYLASAIVTLGLTFGFLLPTFALVFTGAKLGIEKVGSLDVLKGVPHGTGGAGFFENLVDTLVVKASITHALSTVGHFFPIKPEDIVETLRTVARTAGVKIGAGLGYFLTHLPGMVLSVGVMIVSIFFFVGDAQSLADFIRKHSVFSSRQTERLMEAFTSMSRSVLLASLASGFAQAFLFWVACLILGTSNTTLIGFLVFFASFIPLLGSAPITFLVGLHELFVVDTLTGVILILLAVVIMGLDNIVRAMVLKGAGHIHPLLAFVAAFGGLQVFGMAGVFLGPVIAGVFLAMIETLAPAS